MGYEDEIGIEKRRRVQRLLAAFPYLLRHRIQPNTVMTLISDIEYPRDPKHTLLLYDDKTNNDDDEEAAAVANTEEITTVGSVEANIKKHLLITIIDHNIKQGCNKKQEEKNNQDNYIGLINV